MQIDWLTVAAQMVNFVILVWVLKRLLYQPVLDAMARREHGIAQRLGQAEQREQQADAQVRLYEEKERTLERERDHRLAQAHEEAQRERRRLLEEARHDIDKQREKWREDLWHEQEGFRVAFRHGIAESALHIARNALADLADAGLERQILSAFVRRLQALPEVERGDLAAEGRLRVTTSFDLDAKAREQLGAALREVLGAGLQIEYRRDPTLVGGIEVAGEGRKLAWNISDYAEETEGRIAELLGERGEAAAAGA